MGRSLFPGHCQAPSLDVVDVVSFSLQVMKRHVDNYQPGRRIPSCQLDAQYELSSTDSKPVPLRYRVKLLGAKKPHNMFTITIRPPSAGTHHFATGLSSSSSSSASKRSSEGDPSEGTDVILECVLLMLCCVTVVILQAHLRRKVGQQMVNNKLVKMCSQLRY